MKPRLLFAFLIIVLVPAGLVAWLSWRVGKEEQHRVRRELSQLMTGGLANTRTSVDRVIQERESEVFGLLSKFGYASEAEWRSIQRRHPWIRQVFVLDQQGLVLFPNLEQPEKMTERERAFLDRSRAVFESGGAFSAGAESGIAPSNGWHTWYWNNGIHLIAWSRVAKSGRVIGVELERMRLLADILASLPADGVDRDLPVDAQVQLRDANGRVLYAWGGFEPAEDQAPLTVLKLNPPLAAWNLEYYSSGSLFTRTTSKASLVNLAWVIGAAALGLFLVSAWFFREHCRDMREASERVSFVNQVSHELKTPLTNIRMYAEMLESKLEDSDQSAQRCVDVVVGESQRLSRLISNVLTFSRSGQGKLNVQPRPGVVDDVIASAIDHFRPVLEAAEFEIEFEAGAADRCNFDPDALEQILTNLIGNVEKYACEGKQLKVSSRLDEDFCEISVSDSGPGVPPNKHKLIFQPFERISDKLSDAAGTGIGLSIARNLARLHGGDVVICDPASAGENIGACFRVTFKIELIT
ncbi:MAG: signal transduction histidine kinase [Verrucomicrobiales bacterium]|jgi:signal transduction histidine kinase